MPRHWTTSALHALSSRQLLEEFDPTFEASVLRPYYDIHAQNLPQHLAGMTPLPPSHPLSPPPSSPPFALLFHGFILRDSSLFEIGTCERAPQTESSRWSAMLRRWSFCGGNAVCAKQAATNSLALAPGAGRTDRGGRVLLVWRFSFSGGGGGFNGDV